MRTQTGWVLFVSTKGSQITGCPGLRVQPHASGTWRFGMIPPDRCLCAAASLMWRRSMTFGALMAPGRSSPHPAVLQPAGLLPRCGIPLPRPCWVSAARTAPTTWTLLSSGQAAFQEPIRVSFSGVLHSLSVAEHVVFEPVNSAQCAGHGFHNAQTSSLVASREWTN